MKRTVDSIFGVTWLSRQDVARAILSCALGLIAACGPADGIGGSPTVRVAKIRQRLGAPSLGVAVGDEHSCAVLADGRAKCWGTNLSGELGDGTQIGHWMPAPVPGLSNVAQISAGGFYGARHTCARLNDGSVRCWGSNSSGQLGDGTTTGRLSPVAVTGLTNAAQMALGRSFSCAIAGGGVRCWGSNQSGQLGDGTTVSRGTPAAVAGITNATQISLGDAHACAILADGSVRCWGSNASGQLGDGSTADRPTPVAVQGLSGVAQISAGFNHSCALAGGGVRCWGSNREGQLGDGTLLSRLTPVAVLDLTDVTFVATSNETSWAGLGDGSVRAWGNGLNSLGDGEIWSRPIPVTIPDLVNVTQIAGGYRHHCALLADGGAQCWGRNYSAPERVNGPIGRPGSYVTRPTPLVGFTGGTQIGAGGRFHACGVLGDGHMQCWSASGGLNGDGTAIAHASPRNVLGLDNVVAASTGEAHSCAVLGDGTAACWGRNFNGQLGDGTTQGRLEPVPVIGLSNVVGLAVGGGEISRPHSGGFHTCAVTDDGGAQCWGYNQDGQLGDGTTTTRLVPTRVVGLAGPVTQVSVGDNFSCAVLGSGAVQCWGANTAGQLGDGTTMRRLAPVTVSGLSTVTQLSIGGMLRGLHACVILADGTARCWGNGYYGQLGNGMRASSPVPVMVSGLSNVITLAAASSHTCALVSGGAVRCWGENLMGQLGDGTTALHTTPAPVIGLSNNVLDIAAGNLASWALLAEGSALGWGSPPGIDVFNSLTPIDVDLGL